MYIHLYKYLYLKPSFWPCDLWHLAWILFFLGHFLVLKKMTYAQFLEVLYTCHYGRSLSLTDGHRGQWGKKCDRISNWRSSVLGLIEPRGIHCQFGHINDRNWGNLWFLFSLVSPYSFIVVGYSLVLLLLVLCLLSSLSWTLFIHIKKPEAHSRIWCLSPRWVSGSKQYMWDKFVKWLVIYWYALACYPAALSEGITDTEPALISCGFFLFSRSLLSPCMSNLVSYSKTPHESILRGFCKARLSITFQSMFLFEDSAWKSKIEMLLLWIHLLGKRG